MLRFLLDEHLRGPLWSAIVRHNALGGLAIDALRVGDVPDLPLGIDDLSILSWAEDVHTMPGHLANHQQSGIADDYRDTIVYVP